MTALHFDPVAHRYTYEGRELISVTQALKVCGLINSHNYTEEAAERGTAIHAAVQGLYHGGFDPATLPAEWVPYMDAWLAFLTEGGFTIDGCEERVCDPVMGYAGTLDLRGRFANYTSGVDLIDIKTGTVPEWVGYQTAAYARLVTGRPIRRWALNLRVTGTYRLEPLTARTDERVFLAALTVAQAKKGWM